MYQNPVLTTGFKPARRLRCTSAIVCAVLAAPVWARDADLFNQSAQQQTASQAAPQAAVMRLGEAVERGLAGGQKHSYQVALKEGELASVIAEQHGIDIVLRWFGPDEKLITEIDAESRPQGEERSELVAQMAGSYRLNVEPRQQKAAAGKYVIRLVDLRAATEKERALQDARRAYTDSLALRRAGNNVEALAVGERGLAVLEKWLGPEHLELAASLNNLAFVYRDKGDFAKAEELFSRALQIREKSLGPDHPSVAAAANNLAILYKDQAEFKKAEQLYRRALSILEKALPAGHPNIAYAIGNLAEVARLKGDYVRAEELNQRSLEILEKTLGPKHPEVGVSLNNLGNVYKEKGDYAGAEPLYRRALAIFEEAFGPDHGNVAFALGNLADVARIRGDYAAAESLNQRVLEICQKAFGPENPNVAFALADLAITLRNRGDLARAQELYERAVAILEKTLGPNHPEVASSLNNLAVLYNAKGDLAKAEALCQRALDIREKALGLENPGVSDSLGNLATIYAAKGDLARAVAAQKRSNSIIEHNIALNLATGSERQKLAYLTSLSEVADRTLSLHVRFDPDDPNAQELAALTVLQRKGRVLDAMSDILASLRQRLVEQDRALLDELSEITSQLATLVLNGPKRGTLDEHEKRIKALEEQREKLESGIGRRSAGFYEPAAPVTLAAIQASIPEDAALVEFARFRPFNPQAADISKAYGEPRYVAYILRQQGAVQWKELGDAKAADEAIGRLREALRDPKRRDVRQLARALDERIMQPLRASLGDAAQLLISPDGALNLIPFEALVDEQNQYQIQRYEFTYLTSGRDLLRLQIARPSTSNPVVVANPLFGEPGPTAKAGAPQSMRVSQNRKQSASAMRQSVTSGTDLSDVYFAPLSGTAQEAQAIKSLFPEASVFTAAKATESILKLLAAPRLLHIATHGFFLTGVSAATSDAGRQSTGATNTGAASVNPLLRSGIALAGANLHKSNDDDGILTALEASGLNLWGTKLVTLSACDSGIGEVRNGEGVYGLRRAFVLAGTESLVMSLWPVSDFVTREMMTAYYTGLKQGMGRGTALRQVQLAMLKRKGREHPFYWATFIQSGEWGNLDGKR